MAGRPGLPGKPAGDGPSEGQREARLAKSKVRSCSSSRTGRPESWTHWTGHSNSRACASEEDIDHPAKGRPAPASQPPLRTFLSRAHPACQHQVSLIISQFVVKYPGLIMTEPKMDPLLEF